MARATTLLRAGDNYVVTKSASHLSTDSSLAEGTCIEPCISTDSLQDELGRKVCQLVEDMMAKE